MEKIKVTLVHSLIGESPKQKATAKALGLSKMGKVKIVSHLVKVENV